MRIAVVVGTRPTFIDLAPIISHLKDRCELLIYNTGQHYDKEMSDIFIKQLNIPDPYHNFDVRGDTHAEQTANIMIRCEEALIKDKPDTIIVKGDTNSALGAALAAAKLRVPIVHIEAGCRSYDKTLPEEVNRVLISHITKLHFPPTLNCKNNLLREGIDEKSIGIIGHPVVDAINLVKGRIKPIDGYKYNYYFATIHRDFNTDNRDRLKYILLSLNELAKKDNIILALHPRTRKRIREYNIEDLLTDIKVMPPVDYITSLSLTSHAYALITDSGGLTKEACIFGTPIITLRPNTEWIETLQGYANQLAYNSISRCIDNLTKNYSLAKESMNRLRGIFGDVGISKDIVDHILDYDYK